MDKTTKIRMLSTLFFISLLFNIVFILAMRPKEVKLKFSTTEDQAHRTNSVKTYLQEESGDIVNHGVDLKINWKYKTVNFTVFDNGKPVSFHNEN